MNGFLVLLSCGFDDLPVRLFETHAAATSFAEQLDPEGAFEVASLPSMAMSTPSCSKVVTFRDGKPTAVDVVKSYDD